MKSEVTLGWTQARAGDEVLHAEDPLAARALESQIAALFWPGFTRHTTQPAYYVMVCYGLVLAEEAATRQGLVPSDDVIRTLFHQWERVWTAAVSMAKDAESNGHGRQGRRLGALGSYLSSLRDHGLVRADRLRLTPLGWDLAQYLRDEHHDHLVELVGSGALKRSAALKTFGERAALGTLAARKDVRDTLWHRLFVKSEPRFSALSEMTSLVMAERGDIDARALFERTMKSPHTSSHMRDIAQLALVFGDLCTTLRTIFDRTYQTVLAGGFASAWSTCVHAAVPQGLTGVLNEHINNWRRFARAEQMMAPMAYSPKFIQVVRRMNSQNAYHIFESVLFMHVQMQRIRGKGAWIDRKGEVVYLRHTGYERFAIAGGEWAPGYRVAQMRALIGEVAP